MRVWHWLARASAVALAMLMLIGGSGTRADAQQTTLCSESDTGPSPPSTVRVADELVKKQLYDTAMELYRAVLAKDPRDSCAARGLARIGEEQREAAKAEPAVGNSRLKRAEKLWDAFYARWFAPATGLVLPMLAVLLVLVAVARLVTRLVVPVNAQEWPGLLRRAAWWIGLTMLTLAASLPVVLSSPPRPLDGDASAADAAFVVAGLIAATGLVFLTVAPRWTRRGRAVAVVGELVVAAAAGLAGITLTTTGGRGTTDLPAVALVIGLLGCGVLLTFISFATWVPWFAEELGTRWRPSAAGMLKWTAHLVGVVAAALVAAAVADLLLADVGVDDDRGWPWAVWLWALSVALAVLGAVLVDAAAGLRLRLQVETRNADGDADAAATQYLTGRLHELGSEPPKGLEVTEQTDVTALPEDALTSLPQGRVATALVSLLRAVVPTVPWRATVSLIDDDTATVAIVRNSRVVQRERISRSELGLPAFPVDGGSARREEAPAQARMQLLTAAAMILFALAERHPRLRAGLCDATKWQSTALQVLATQEPIRSNPDDAQRLLRAARDLDRQNAVARVAYLYFLGREGDLEGERQFATCISREYRQIFGDLMEGAQETAEEQEKRERRPPREGFEALQLRMLFNMAASRLNVHLLTDTGAGEQVEPAARQAWHKARDAARWLIRRLAQIEADDEQLADFARRLRPLAGYLWYGIRDRAHRSLFDDNQAAAWAQEQRTVECAMKDWALHPEEWVGPEASYHRACWRAERRVRDQLHLAIKDLRDAQLTEEDKRWARKDPSFLVFRSATTDDPLRCDYKRIVGETPPSEFLELPPFARHAEQLRAYGIEDAEQLLQASSWRLALHLGVDRSTVDRWKDIAGLAAATAGNQPPEDVVWMYLLLNCDVASRDALKKRLRNEASRTQLYNELVKAATDLAVEPKRAATVDCWCNNLIGRCQARSPSGRVVMARPPSLPVRSGVRSVHRVPSRAGMILDRVAGILPTIIAVILIANGFTDRVVAALNHS
jgi:hypothetical protein